MKRIIFLLVGVISVSNLLAATVDSSAVVDGKYVTYKGNVYEINCSEEQSKEESIVAAAKAVYAFQVAEVALTTGNSSDHSECFYNEHSDEYAVQTQYTYQGKVHTNYVVFSLKGAQLVKELPAGFGFANYEDIDFIGFGKKAGWVMAKLNGCHNSMVVFIK